LEASLKESGIAVAISDGDLLVNPAAIRNKDGRGLRVFTPFWKRVLALGDPSKPMPAPRALNGYSDLDSDTV
jgi:deoxyribodipyrimidine photo-lyase